MNKKGVYFASFSILLVIFMIIGYSFVNDRKEAEAGIDDLGKFSVGLITSNFNVEKLRFEIEEAIKISKELALKNIKDNAGVYDKINCGLNGDYIVLGTGCDYLNPEENFYHYFNDSFDRTLKGIDPKFNSDEFNIEILNNGLDVKGTKRVSLDITKEIKSTTKKTVTEKDSFKFDEKLNSEILSYIERYSQEYNVPEDLVKAVIIKESGGNINAVGSNPDSTDYGLMQINSKAHPDWFDGSRGCRVNEDVSCNIKAGTEILKSGYDRFKDGKTYTCTGKTYTNWEAALRAYNGWGCLNLDYVESVLSLLGEEISTYITQDTEVYRENVGYIELDLDYHEEVGYNFRNINDAILRGRTIKDCVNNGEDVFVCASRENDLFFIFNARIEGNVIKFDVEELETGDIIKFALNI
ncbi:MAG: transglycosylase SLT domain-containing protein [Nanoarchaeota archaeon]|nr:transglycosylase SLT domain-containing protein [Nanoarchaeota archaeon]